MGITVVGRMVGVMGVGWSCRTDGGGHSGRTVW